MKTIQIICQATVPTILVAVLFSYLVTLGFQDAL